MATAPAPPPSSIFQVVLQPRPSGTEAWVTYFRVKRVWIFLLQQMQSTSKMNDYCTHKSPKDGIPNFWPRPLVPSCSNS